MKEYYATTTSNSTIGYWAKLKAKNLTGAKQEATALHGNGYIGHYICVVGVEQSDADYNPLNDLPYWQKQITQKRSNWTYIY